MTDFLHVYSICHNEMDMLPFYLRHYRLFADRIFIHDNFSDDGTREFLKKQPDVTLLDYHSGGQLRDDLHLKMKNNMWKISRGEANWVAVVDVDEFLYHEDMIGFIGTAEARGAVVVDAEGFQMVCDFLPDPGRRLDRTVRTGFRRPDYNKTCLFRPDAVKEINYTIGAHWANPAYSGERIGGIKLLHYSHLGRQETYQRILMRRHRMSWKNISNGWGQQYMATRRDFYKEFDAWLSYAKEILPSPEIPFI